MTLVRHGAPRVCEADVDTLVADFDLTRTGWDLDMWADAHPCTCPEDAGVHEPGCPQW